jgi:hypothetical protein
VSNPISEWFIIPPCGFPANLVKILRLEKSLHHLFIAKSIFRWIRERRCIPLVMREWCCRIIFDQIGIRLWLIGGE